MYSTSLQTAYRWFQSKLQFSFTVKSLWASEREKHYQDFCSSRKAFQIRAQLKPKPNILSSEELWKNPAGHWAKADRWILLDILRCGLLIVFYWNVTAAHWRFWVCQNWLKRHKPHHTDLTLYSCFWNISWQHIRETCEIWITEANAGESMCRHYCVWPH